MKKSTRNILIGSGIAVAGLTACHNFFRGWVLPTPGQDWNKQ